MSGLTATTGGPAAAHASDDVIEACAATIDDAMHRREAITRITEAHQDLTVEDAYRIQDERTHRRVAAGDRLIGAKLGLTARAKQVQMKVDQPVYGRLFASDLHPSSEPVRADRYIHPRVEPEIVFLMGEDLEGPGVHAAEVLAATESICCGMEILDSRFADFSFAAADVIADNTSEAGIVLGSRMVDPGSVDLRLLGIMLETDGEFAASAAGAAVSGHPAEAVAMLVNWLAERGEGLDAGALVYSGGMTAAVPVLPGRSVTATFAHLGSVTVRGA